MIITAITLDIIILHFTMKETGPYSQTAIFERLKFVDISKVYVDSGGYRRNVF